MLEVSVFSNLNICTLEFSNSTSFSWRRIILIKFKLFSDFNFFLDSSSYVNYIRLCVLNKWQNLWYFVHWDISDFVFHISFNLCFSQFKKKTSQSVRVSYVRVVSTCMRLYYACSSKFQRKFMIGENLEISNL